MPVKIIKGLLEYQTEIGEFEKSVKPISELEKEINKFESELVKSGGEIISITPFGETFQVAGSDMYGDFIGTSFKPYTNFLIRYKENV